MKDFKISRELLSEVLKIEVVKHSLFNKRNNTFNITYMQSEDSLKADWMLVNIYEFVFKCKDWIISKDYYLSTFIDFGVDNYFCEIKWFNSEYIIQNKNFIADTELEVIFKACEWILSEVNK